MPLPVLKIIEQGKKRDQEARQKEHVSPKSQKPEFRFHLPHAYKHWGVKKHQTSFGDPS